MRRGKSSSKNGALEWAVLDVTFIISPVTVSILFLPFAGRLLILAMQRIDHFHVHIVNASYTGLGTGMTVGQAWLLDDVISLVSILSFFLTL